MIYKQPLYLGKHVKHVHRLEVHAELNYAGLGPVQAFLYDLGDHIEQQRHKMNF